MGAAFLFLGCKEAAINEEGRADGGEGRMEVQVG